MEIRDYLAARRRFFEEHLGGFLPQPDAYSPILRRAMEYSLFAGGKRLRPILTLAAAEACGGSVELALAPAVALEMVHTYSLIHDDLPAMDDDDLRRGKPTSHKVFGEDMAILAGDALLTHAFTVLAEARGLEAGLRLALVGELALAAGPMGMVAGQALDIQGLVTLDVDELKYLHQCKTGSLFRAAVRMGAIVAGATPEVLASLSDYATSLGLAYQIVDDILDVTATSIALGKNPGNDARQDKQTFVTICGLPEARTQAAEITQAAIDALGSLEGSEILRGLAKYIGSRQH